MVTQVKDYLDAVQKRFPYLSKEELTKIIEYGLRKYVKVNLMHGDVLFKNLTDEPMSMMCGMLMNDKLRQFMIWLTKWRMKERILFKFRKEVWDGYYYIGINTKQHKELLKQGKTKTFKNVFFTKLRKELLHNKIVTHVWRVPYAADCGWKFFVKEYRTKDAEYVGKNDFYSNHTCYLKRLEDDADSNE